MRGLAVLLMLPALVVPARAQPAGPPAWPDPPQELLVVGTFHFQDAGLDSYRPQFDVDILSPERQREVGALVERLAAFRPTRVAVEVGPEHQPWLDSLYAAYLAGAYTPGSNEIFQLGFRLARAAGHARVHAVGADRRFYEPWVDPDSFAVARGQADLLDPELEENDRARSLRSHGQYLIGNFEVGTAQEYPGVDSKTAWFNRNLRIFANLQRLLERDTERIVLGVGAGHLALLQHAAEASPQFRLVELAEVLADRR